MPTYYFYIITRFFENLACESVSFNIFCVRKNTGTLTPPFKEGEKPTPVLPKGGALLVLEIIAPSLNREGWGGSFLFKTDTGGQTPR